MREVLIHVCAAALKPVDKQLAGGKHFATPRELPVVCGADGVGRLEDGTRVFFGGPRRPYGAMAERTVVRRACTGQHFLNPTQVKRPYLCKVFL
jgi:NADPH:quinone reductase-like Zn-dependent oxidoreductase